MKMKKSQLSYAIWPWGTKTEEQAEFAAKEVTDIGYRAFESVKTSIYAYDFNVENYKAMLDKYSLKPISFYFHIPVPEDVEGFFETAEKELQFVQALGVTRVTLQGTYGRPKRELTDQERDFNLENILKFANLAKKYGIQTNVHPHVDTRLMFEEDIDYVMENTPADLVFLAPDTAHLAAAGADPVKVIKKYADRVNFTHFKDYKLGDEVTDDGWVDSDVPIMSCFHALGDGTIDFPAIIKILEDVNYTGPLCIELDKPPVSHAESAKKSYDYLAQFLED